MQRLVVYALVGALGACGSVAEQPHDAVLAADFTIAATPATLGAPILGTATVTVAIVRTGQVGEIVVTATGSQTITAAPATIAADATSTELTFTLGAGTTPGPATLTITGSDGTHTHDATVTINASPLATVTGKVRGNRANIFVGIVGMTPTASGADGSFTFTNVTPPYDLYTYVPASTALSESKPPQVYYYRGLTTPTPFVNAGATAGFLVSPVTLPRSADVSGSLTGTGAASPKKLIAWSSGGSTSSGGSSYSLTAAWRSSSPTSGLTVSGTMYGLGWTTRPNGAPDQVYFGSTTASLSNGAASSGVNIALDPVASTQVSGTVSPPAGFSSPTLTLRALLSPTISTHYVLWTGSSDAAASIPTIAGATLNLKASASGAGGTTTTLFPDPSTLTDVTTTLPTPAVLVTPTANATAVSTATPFHFSAPATGQVYVVSAVAPSAELYVITTDDTVTLPDVAELPLPAATTFTWKVEGYAPATTVDDAALQDAPEGIDDADFEGPAHSYTTSATRTFTTP
jgi:hypothetical protein